MNLENLSRLFRRNARNLSSSPYFSLCPDGLQRKSTAWKGWPCQSMWRGSRRPSSEKDKVRNRVNYRTNVPKICYWKSGKSNLWIWVFLELFKRNAKNISSPLSPSHNRLHQKLMASRSSPNKQWGEAGEGKTESLAASSQWFSISCSSECPWRLGQTGTG